MTTNPFFMIRRRLRLPQRGIEGLSVATVQRIESGHYENLSDGMVEALVAAVEKSGLDFEDIAEQLEEEFGTPYLSLAYARWRKIHREETGRRVKWPNLDTLGTGGESPMGQFARTVSGSVHKFCGDFSIQGPTLARYIEGKFDYLEPPSSLSEALDDAGYTEKQKLFRLQRDWIERVR